MVESNISVVNSESLLTLFGTRDQHVRKIRDVLGVSITVRNGQIHIEGDPKAVADATEVLEQLQNQANLQGALGEEDVGRILAAVRNGQSAAQTAPVEVLRLGRQVRPKTSGQARYVEAIRNKSIVFCSGPAGTGKTYLAVATAVAALKQQTIRKLVLVRPAVEAR